MALILRECTQPPLDDPGEPKQVPEGLHDEV